MDDNRLTLDPGNEDLSSLSRSSSLFVSPFDLDLGLLYAGENCYTRLACMGNVWENSHYLPMDPTCTSSNEDGRPCKFDSCIDEIRPLLGPSLESRIRTVLQEFVCNSGSRYAQRFPRAKKFLDVVASWTDCFDVSAKNTDIRREVIKHAIEYLLKDGLVTRFADQVVLNSGSNNVDPDSLAAEQNALKSMNVWRFISEKDYWLRQNSASNPVAGQGSNIRNIQANKGNYNSDLDVEVGSVSIESTPYWSCRTSSSCSPLCLRKGSNKNPSEIKSDCRNSKIIPEAKKNKCNCQQECPNSYLNDSKTSRKESENVQNSQKHDIGVNCNCKETTENKRSLETQTSLRTIFTNFHFKPNQSTLNNSNEISHNFSVSKSLQVGENIKMLNAETMCNRSNFSKGSPRGSEKFQNLRGKENTKKSDSASTLNCRSSKIKIYVHKTTSTGYCKAGTPARVSKLFLPCRSSQLIVRLFEADPTLSDSCLILMRKKFEKDIKNACSCINDILRKLESSVIKQLYLSCLIRPGRVDLNLDRKDGRKSKVRRFLARVPTCSNVHKRESCRGNRESCEEPGDRCGETQRSMDLPVDPCCSSDATKRGKEFEERYFTFLSSNVNLTEKDNVSPLRNQIENDKRSENVTLVWTRKKGKCVNFEFPAGLMKCGKEENSASLHEKKGEKMGTTGKELSRDKHEQNFEQKAMESCNLNCTCSENLKEGGFGEDHSTTGGCNPEQCLCHVFCADKSINNDEQYNKLGKEDLEGRLEEEFPACSCGLKENTRVEEPGLKIENHKPRDSVSRKNICGLGEQNGVSTKGKGAEQSETNYFESMERRESALEEKYSVDSICPPKSFPTDSCCDTNCSACGDQLDHSDPQRAVVDFTIIQTPNSPFMENSSTVVEGNSKIITEAYAAYPVHDDRSSRSSKKSFRSSQTSLGTVDHHRNNFSDESLEDRRKNSREPKSDHEIVLLSNYSETKFTNSTIPSVPESLFVFCKKVDWKESSTSDSSEDEENIRNNCSCSKNVKACPKWRSLNEKSRAFAKCHPACSTNDLHRSNSTKHKTGPKVEENNCHCGPSLYKNRPWRGSIVPGSLCSSFPAIDRLKYLIRKKLRKLLLEERDKGTSTSKTFLRNDRYLVSISSGKLNKGRIIRESCSIRCPFTTRNRYDTGGMPETTFTEGSVPRKKNESFGDTIRDKCRKMIPGHDAFRKMKVTKISKTLGQKFSSKSTDTRDLFEERRKIIVESKVKIKDCEQFPLNASVNGRNCGKCPCIMSRNSTERNLLKDDDEFLKQRLARSEKFARKIGRNIEGSYCLHFGSSKDCSCKNNFWCRCPTCWKENKKGGKRVEERRRQEKLKSFEKRVLEIEGDGTKDYNFVSFFNDYEKHINDLDADFRLKLLQYVALCRSVKNSLIKRLQLDDVYEVNSTSA